MIVVVYRKAPWWQNDPENRPSKESFEGWLATGAQSFPINKATISRGIRTLTINLYVNNGKYFKIKYDDFTYYYFVKNLNLIANGLYQYEIEIDLWTTFCIPYLQKLKEKRALLKFKRASAIPLNSHINQQSQYNDPLLDEIQPQYNGINYLFQKNITKFTLNGQTFYQSSASKGQNYQSSKRFVTDGNGDVYTTEYYVFSTVDGRYLDCYPVISQKRNTAKIGWRENNQLHNFKIYNNHPGALNQLKIDNEVRFKGIYILPSIMHWDMEVNGEPFVGGGLSDLLAIRIDPQKPIVNWLHVEHKYEITTASHDYFKLNIGNKLLSPAILKYFNFKLYNTELFPTDFMQPHSLNPIFGNVSNDGVNWKFTNKAILFTGSKYSKIDSIPKELTGQLPSISSSYDRFVAENQTSINAGIGLSILPVLASVLGVVITAATGGIGAGIGAGIATASIAGAVSGSGAKIGSTLARVQDAKNANQTTNSNTMSRDAFWSQGVVPYDKAGKVENAGIIINYVDIVNIEEYNNIIVKYGYIINKRSPISLIFDFLETRQHDYCYFLIDIDQTYQENKDLNDIAPSYFINEILDEFRNGVRLWKPYHITWNYAN